MRNIHKEIAAGIKAIKRRGQKPQYLIVDKTTHDEIGSDIEEYFTGSAIDSSKYFGLKVAIVDGDETILEIR